MKKIVCLLFTLGTISFGQTKLIVLHTNNVNGQLENCICVGHPYGALEKQKVMVDKFRKGKDPVLYLNAGDMLSAFGFAEKDSFAVAQVQAMNFDAIVPGDQEFSNGVEFFQEHIQNRSLPMVAANFSLNGKKPFAPYLTKEINGLKVAILGIVSKDAFAFFPREKMKGVEVSDYRNAIRESLEKIGDADLVILLSHLGYETDQLIAKEFPAIRLIVGGHTQSVLHTVEKIGTTYIVQAGNDGYYLGQADLSFDPNKNLVAVTGNLTPMNIDLPNDPQISYLAKLYNLREIHHAAVKTPFLTPLSKSYTVKGSRDCVKCHASQAADWQKTSHSRSWDSLVKEGKTKLMQCMSCHTSGFGRIDGFMNVNLTKELSAVTCTECHWTDPGHLTRPSKQNVTPISENHCVRCHDAANSPRFQFAVYKEKAAHKKLAAERPAVVSSTPGSVSGEEYMVKEGDTLFQIAREMLGRENRWIEIYEVNKDVLRDPNLIYPGQKLKLPNR